MANNSTNFVVSSLADYVATNRDIIINSFGLLGGGTRSRITTLTGIKFKEKLNYLEIEPELQSGEDCEFTAQEGGLTLSQREIEVAPIKVDIDLCPRTLRKKYAQYLIRMNAVAEGERIPFEREITDGLVARINKKIDTLMWQGSKASLDANLKWINGYLTMLASETDAIAVGSLGTSAYEGILKVFMALPEQVLERGAEIYVSPAIFRAFMQDLVVKNYFNYAGAQNANPDEFILPGTDAKVVKTEGLAGSLTIVGTFAKNLVYGTDMEGDEEDLDIWYSKDDRVFKFEALWNSGVQYYFPNMIAYGTFASAPVVGAGVNESLAKLAGAVNADGQVETHPNE